MGLFELLSSKSKSWQKTYYQNQIRTLVVEAEKRYVSLIEKFGDEISKQTKPEKNQWLISINKEAQEVTADRLADLKALNKLYIVFVEESRHSDDKEQYEMVKDWYDMLVLESKDAFYRNLCAYGAPGPEQDSENEDVRTRMIVIYQRMIARKNIKNRDELIEFYYGKEKNLAK